MDGTGDPISPAARPWSKRRASLMRSISDVGSTTFPFPSRPRGESAGSNASRAQFTQRGRVMSNGASDSFARASNIEKAETAQDKMSAQSPA